MWDELNNVALICVNRDEVECQDGVAGRHKQLEFLMQKQHLLQLANQTNRTRQLLELSGDQVAQDCVGRDIIPLLNGIATSTPLEADVNNVKGDHCKSEARRKGMIAGTNNKSCGTKRV